MSAAPKGKVLTFYSFKGGVGRSMILANVAWILASNGHRVLMVDWDLEAPGLHHYFSPFLPSTAQGREQQQGLLDLLIRYQMEVTAEPEDENSGDLDWYHPFANVKEYVIPINWHFPRRGSLSLMSAGRRGPGYPTRVQKFDWVRFYTKQGGGGFLDTVKQNMCRSYDYVLIDSRTGYSDTAGICTIQLPDEVIIIFSPNNQCIEGSVEIANTIQEKHRDREKDILIWPILSRDDNSETELSGRARSRVREVFRNILVETLSLRIPKADTDIEGSIARYMRDVSAPYIPLFAFEEGLAVFFESDLSRESLLYSVLNLSRYLLGKPVDEEFDIPLPTMTERDRIKAAYRNKKSILYGLGPLPKNYVPMPEATNYFRKLLEVPVPPDSAHAGECAKVGIAGLPGMGKTDLAKSIAYSLAQDNQYEAIIWLTIEQPTDNLKIQGQLSKLLNESIPGPVTVEQGVKYLRRVFYDKHYLLILDGIEEAQQIEAVNVLGENGRVLFTTTKSELLTGPTVQIHHIRPLDRGKAEEVLLAWAEQSAADMCARDRALVKEVIQASGGIPKRLQVWGREMSTNRISWRELAVQVSKPDVDDPLFQTITQIISKLDADLQALCRHLIVFPAETQIPHQVFEVLNYSLANPVQQQFNKLIDQLADFNLVQRENLDFVQIDPTFKRYLQYNNRSNEAESHSRLLKAYCTRSKTNDWLKIADDGYYLDHLVYHLIQAANRDEAAKLLLNYDWLQHRLNTTDIRHVLEDFELYLSKDVDTKGEGMITLRRALRLSSHVLQEHKTQLGGQLLGRLSPKGHQNDLKTLLTQIERRQTSPWLKPLSPSLAPADGPLVYILRGHEALIHAVAMQKDGRIGVSASGDNTLIVWDLNLGRGLKSLTGHNKEVRGVAISADGHLIASGSSDKTVRLWETATGKELHCLEGHEGGVRAVALTPDGEYVISASEDHTLRVWETANGRLHHRFSGHTGTIRAVAVSGNGRFIVSGAADGHVIIWELESGNRLHDLMNQDICGVDFNKEGNRVISVAKDGRVVLWDLCEEQTTSTSFDASCGVTEVEATDLSWSDDEKYIFIACSDSVLRIRNQDTQTITELTGHTARVNAVDIATTHFGYRLLTAGGDNTARVWHRFDELTQIRRLFSHHGLVTGILVDKHGRLACSQSNSEKRTEIIWDIAEKTRVDSCEENSFSIDAPSSFQESCNGEFALSISADGGLVLTQGPDKYELARFYCDDPVTSYTFVDKNNVTPIIIGDKGGRVHFLGFVK